MSEEIAELEIIIFVSFHLGKELEESFNYGLYLPPSNGKAGKFLDEERKLCEYPFSGPIGYLEVRKNIELFWGTKVTYQC